MKFEQIQDMKCLFEMFKCKLEKINFYTKYEWKMPKFMKEIKRINSRVQYLWMSLSYDLEIQI